MKLLTKALEKQLPKFHAGDHTAYVKYFAPWGCFTWYGCEYDPELKEFYGWVEGHYSEWGYFSLTELEDVTGPFGLKIERDLYFKPTVVGDIDE